MDAKSEGVAEMRRCGDEEPVSDGVPRARWIANIEHYNMGVNTAFIGYFRVSKVGCRKVLNRCSDWGFRDVVLVSGDEVGAYLAVAVVFETEAFVDGAQAGAGGDAIQAEVAEAECFGAFRGPVQKRGGQAGACVGSPYGQAMNVGGFLRGDV